ncbi:MAG: hypothetical protein IJR85_01035 [Synergistaceae bacterium]|nr:hypothetical protein [Synergistaceae bacterium]
MSFIAKMWKQILYIAGIGLCVFALGAAGHPIAAVAVVLLGIAGFAAYEYIAHRKEQAEITRRETDILMKAMGSVSYVSTYSDDDMLNWVDAHAGMGKVLVARINNKVFDLMVKEQRDEGYSIDFEADKFFKSLLLAVMDESGKITERAVVKYENLTPEFEQFLDENNGFFNAKPRRRG